MKRTRKQEAEESMKRTVITLSVVILLLALTFTAVRAGQTRTGHDTMPPSSFEVNRRGGGYPPPITRTPQWCDGCVPPHPTLTPGP